MNDTQLETIFHERLEYFGMNVKNTGGQSDKFYEVKVESDTQNSEFIETRTWGRYGASGSEKVIRHYARAMAIASAKKQLAKKIKKGYTKPVNALKRLATAADDE